MDFKKLFETHISFAQAYSPARLLVSKFPYHSRQASVYTSHNHDGNNAKLIFSPADRNIQTGDDVFDKRNLFLEYHLTVR